MKKFQTIVTAVLTVPNGKGGTDIYKWSDSPFSPSSPSHEFYDPRIKEAPTISGRVGLAVHNQKTQGSVSQMAISRFGLPDLHKDPRVRNSEIEITVWKKNSIEVVESVSVIKSIVESVKKNSTTFTINMKSLIAKLDKPLQSRTIPDTIQSSSAKDALVPVAIGWPRSVPVVTTSDVDDEFIAADGTVLSYWDIEDNADPFIPVTDWQYRWEPTAECAGFELTSADYGQITASVEHGPGHFDQAFDADALGGIFNPMAWTGSGTSATPNDWTLVEPAGTYIYPYSGNVWTRFYNHGQTTGGDFYIETVDDVLIPGAKYKLTADVWNVSGDLDLWFDIMTGDDYIGRIELNGVPSAQYTVEIDIIATGPKLKIQGSNYTEGDLSSAIKDVTVEQYNVGTEYLKNFLYYLMCEKGGLDESDVNWSSVDDVVALTNPRLGFYADKAVNIISVMDLVANTVNCWFMEDPDGKISIGTLQDPTALTPVLYVNDNNIKSDTEEWEDTAPGLTDMYPAKRNWFQFDKNNIADIVSENQKILRSQRYRWVMRSTVDVHDFYEHARGNQYPDVLFDQTNNTDGSQFEAGRMCTIYSQIRYFKKFDVTMDEIDIVSLKYGDCVDYYGEKTIIVGKVLKTGSNRITLTVWS